MKTRMKEREKKKKKIRQLNDEQGEKKSKKVQ